tara:strand:+ start:995 stop:1600 length:606 start_codon:yes stop_codon:yes gene_type:complete
MKRPELVKKLMNEGLSGKLLSNLTDKQLKDLSERVLSEETLNIPKDDKPSIDQAKKGGQAFVTYEEDSVGELCEVCEKEPCCCETNEVNEWVEGLVKSNYHPEVTTKKEMYEMIGSLSDSADALGDSKRMFSSDGNIVDEQSPQPSEPDTDAPVREKPTTKPGKPKRENPFEPKHKPKPKAVLPKQLSFASLGIELKQAAE